MASMELTFIASKPDGMQCGLTGIIVQCCEKKRGFCLITMEFPRTSEELPKQHRIDLKDHPSCPGLVKCVDSGLW